MFHRLCLHWNSNIYHTITQDEETNKSRGLWPYGLWLFVRVAELVSQVTFHLIVFLALPPAI